MLTFVKSISLFILAGLFEIGGGYLVWLTIREEKPWWIGALGGIILIGYGIVATWQPANFGRVCQEPQIVKHHCKTHSLLFRSNHS
ncbi:Uncharacterised BCR, YnfA/UPF0060 family [Marivirga sericea]|uniref:Uncharacterized BCR, YnfA/UPF0060 family n=1 Tax=Marivirga sericea TaxID=1028 RepID=A0A1X7IDM9_9BACT|nr:hypothetical protein [Marivirga sericea]SMG12263.1 Uncharacterised BCR, YnfA/UPF0060 family [Marivirga sericea]